MASRNIGDLSPKMQVLCQRHLDRCRRDVDLLKHGVAVIITCSYRSNSEQARLYAQGRDTSVPGPIVTNAKAGQSEHNRTTPDGKPAAEAYDVALLQNGKLLWDNTPVGKELWQRVGEHGMAVGLKWFGAPGSPFPEGCHFQNPEV